MRLQGLELTLESLQEVLSKFPYPIKYSSHVGELNSHGVSFLAKDEKVDLVKIKFDNLGDASEVNDYLESKFSLNIKYKCLYGKSFEYDIDVQSPS